MPVKFKIDNKALDSQIAFVRSLTRELPRNSIVEIFHHDTVPDRAVMARSLKAKGSFNSAQQKHFGVAKASQALKRAFKTQEMRIASSGDKYGPRSGSQNAEIAAAQIRMGRNPWLISKKERGEVLSRAMFHLRKFDKTGKAQFIKYGLGEIATAYIKLCMRHITQQRSGNVPFRELTKSYAKQKKRDFGFTKPILVATGQLKQSLGYRVRVGAK